MKKSLFLSRYLFIMLSVFAILSTYTTSAMAGLFSVSPVRIYMEPKDRAVAVTITNDSDEELVMQADIYTWKQGPDGEDALMYSEDLFLSPPIIKLAGKARQVVRLAVLSPSRSNDELTYRIIVREIPVKKPDTEDAELEIALAFSMPIFITPKTAKSDLVCSAQRSTSNNVTVTCENKGNAYAHPREFVLKNSTGETIAAKDSGGYLLPGTIRSFNIETNTGSLVNSIAKLTVTLDDTSERDFEINLAD